MNAPREVDMVFLIADLSGYTALTETHGDVHAARVVARCVEIARAADLAGVEYRALGPVRFKNIADPVGVLEVVAGRPGGEGDAADLLFLLLRLRPDLRGTPWRLCGGGDRGTVKLTPGERHATRREMIRTMILACLLVAAMLGCAIHAGGGFDHVACAHLGVVVLAPVVFGAVLRDRGIVPSPARAARVPADAVSFFHPPEVPA